MAPGLTSVDFICNIETVESEFGVKNMKVWIRPALDQPLRLLLVVQRCRIKDIFLVHLDP